MNVSKIYLPQKYTSNRLLINSVLDLRVKNFSMITTVDNLKIVSGLISKPPHCFENNTFLVVDFQMTVSAMGLYCTHGALEGEANNPVKRLKV
jgi:hypothetical protein